MALAALLATACAHSSTDQHFLSPTSLMEAAQEVGKQLSDPRIKRLSPDLRRLLRDMVAAGEALSRGEEVPARSEEIPEAIRVSVIYKGALTDLEAAGLKAVGSATALGNGEQLIYGDVSVRRLAGLIEIEHVLSVRGPSRLLPLLNVGATEVGGQVLSCGSWCSIARCRRARPSRPGAGARKKGDPARLSGSERRTANG
jgi:hypothetical protein